MTITAKDYAGLIKVSPALVSIRLKAMRTKILPGAAYVEKLGSTWMITLKPKFNANEAEAEFKRNGK